MLYACNAHKLILQLYDVTAKDKATVLAFTPSALPLHNDLLYYESPPGLQFIHCVRCINDSLPVLYFNTVYNVTAPLYPSVLLLPSVALVPTLGHRFHVLIHRLQSLLISCCRNDACVEGGESMLLDAFAVVEEMREKHPQHFATLARVPATFERKPTTGLVYSSRQQESQVYIESFRFSLQLSCHLLMYMSNGTVKV